MGADTAVALAHARATTSRSTARTRHLLDTVADEITAAGGARCPLRRISPSGRRSRRSQTSRVAEFGRCDVVCNIGIYKGAAMDQLLMETDLHELMISYEADVVAPVVLCQRAIPSMLEHGRGTILNMSSVVGVHGSARHRPRPGLELLVRLGQGRHRPDGEHPQRRARFPGDPGVQRRAGFRRLRGRVRGHAAALPRHAGLASGVHRARDRLAGVRSGRRRGI